LLRARRRHLQPRLPQAVHESFDQVTRHAARHERRARIIGELGMPRQDVGQDCSGLLRLSQLTVDSRQSRVRHVIVGQVDLERHGQSLAIFAFAVVVEEEREVEPSLMKRVQGHGLPDERLASLPFTRIGCPGTEVADHPGVVRIEGERLFGRGVKRVEVLLTHVADDRQRIAAILILRSSSSAFWTAARARSNGRGRVL